MPLRPRPAAAAIAAAAALGSVSPPVVAAAERGLVAHMGQHLLLLTVAGPLAALALPRARPAGRPAVRAAVAVAVHGALLAAWHAPVLFDAAQRARPLHALEHLSLLAAGFALAAAVAPRPGAAAAGAGVLAVFAGALQCTALGAAMTTASVAWYGPPAGGPGSLGDQQVAGAVMWGVGGLAYLAGALALFASWQARAGPALSAPMPTGSRPAAGPPGGPGAAAAGS